MNLPVSLVCQEAEKTTRLDSALLKETYNIGRWKRDNDLRTRVYTELLRLSLCPALFPRLAFQHRLLLHNLDLPKLQSDLNSFLTFDLTLHQHLGCLLDALFTEYSESSPSLPERVRGKMTTPQVLSQENSSYGIVLRSSFVGAEKLFALKVARNGTSLLHEAVIGKVVVNRLRQEVPNFMYTYGYHTCAPYYLKKGEFLTWCASQKGEQTEYLYLENIGGITLHDALQQGLSVTDYLSILFQLVNALTLAYDRYAFLHNDLHPSNIILRPLGQTTMIPFNIGQKKEYIRSNYLAQIIDFGLASAMYQEIDLDSEAGIITEPSLRFDIYHFLLGTAAIQYNSLLRKQNADRSLFQLLEELLSYFGRSFSERAADKLIEFTTRRFVRLSEDEDVYSFNGRDFLRWVSRKTGLSPLSSDPNNYITFPIRLLGDSCRFYERYFVETRLRADQYNDLYSLLKNDSSKKDLLAWFRNHFDPIEAAEAGEKAANFLLEEAAREAEPLSLAQPFRRLIPERIEERYQEYLSYYDKMIILYDRLFLLFWLYQNNIVGNIAEEKSRRLADRIDQLLRFYQEQLRNIQESALPRFYYDPNKSADLSLLYQRILRLPSDFLL